MGRLVFRGLAHLHAFYVQCWTQIVVSALPMKLARALATSPSLLRERRLRGRVSQA